MKKIVSLLLTILMVFSVNVAFAAEGTPTNIENESIKKMSMDGSIPAKWNLQKPKVETHEDSPPVTAGGDGDGSNDISFNNFDSGDIIVVTGTLTGHAGEFDFRYYDNLYSFCIWSANIEPVNGVQLEQPTKYRNYDEAYGLWVPSAPYSLRLDARDYCVNQIGEPYDLTTLKTSEDRWYCSKLAWASYWHVTGLDLDGDLGLYVWPIDLVNDADTSLFAYGD